MVDVFHTYRAREPRERYAALILAKDPDAVSVAAAWEAAEVSFILPESPPPLSCPKQLWLWFWGGCQYDIDEIAELAQLSTHDCEVHLRTLKGFRLIYPDGTIAAVTKEFIEAGINRALMPNGL